MQRNDAVSLDCLKELAFERERAVMHEDDIKDDVTELLFRGIRQKIIKGETPLISIYSQTRKGKSTIACLLMDFENRSIVDLGLIDSILWEKTDKKRREWEKILENKGRKVIELIAPTIHDFNDIMIIPEIRGIGTILDEANALDKTGFDASQGDKWLEFQLKVCAESRLLVTFCSVNNDYGRYADLEIEIIDNDKQVKMTKGKLFYRYNGKRIFLGYVTFDVSDILKKDWYQDYESQKYFSIQMQKKGASIRQCKYALTILLGYQKLKRLAQLGEKEINITRSRIDAVVRDMGGGHSIIGREEIIKGIDGLLTLTAKIKEKQESLKKVQNKRITTEQKLQEEAEINEQIKIISEELENGLGEQRELVKIYVQYKQIGDNSQREKIRKLCEKYQLNFEEVIQ